MKKMVWCLLLIFLTLAGLFFAGMVREVRGAHPAQHTTVFRLLLRRTGCYIFQQQQQSPQSYTDPALVALLARVSAQQDALAAQQQALAIQLATQRSVPTVPQTDPQLVAVLTQLVVKQDQVIDLLRQGKTADPALAPALQQLIAGQERIWAGQDRMLAALQDLAKHQSGPTPPPVIVIPPAPGPPVVVTPPPTGVPGAGAQFPGIPGAGAPFATVPVPGGLFVTPPPGQKLQAVPQPGGGILLVPNGPATPGPGDKPPETPGAGPIIVIPPAGGGTPMVPIPGVNPGTVFRYTTVDQKKR